MARDLAAERVLVPGLYRAEALLLIVEVQLDAAGRTVTVFLYEDIGQFLAVGVGIVVFPPIDEGHHVGILLDGT